MFVFGSNSTLFLISLKILVSSIVGLREVCNQLSVQVTPVADAGNRQAFSA